MNAPLATDEAAPRADRARAWFDTLRDRLVAAFEALEDAAPADLYPGPPGRFELRVTVALSGGQGLACATHSCESRWMASISCNPVNIVIVVCLVGLLAVRP